MNLRMKDIVILAAVMLFSFPVIFFGVLFFTGNARVELGPKKRSPEAENKIEMVKQTAKAESLAIANSRTYQALERERKNIEKEKSSLKEERGRLELYQRDLEAQKTALEKERERIEGLVSKSDTLDLKKTAQLAKVYAAMRPAEAAQIIGTLDDRLAARILGLISDDRQKAKILAALPGEKATAVTQLMGSTTKLKQ